MAGLRSKWVRKFIWAQFGLEPPPDDEDRAAWARDALREHEDRAIAGAVVEFFNLALAEGREPWFMPTVRGAIMAGHPWLIVLCRSCDTVIDMEMRVKPRPRMATILMPFSEVRCPRCNGHGRPAILRLAPQPEPTLSPPPYMPNRPRYLK
jgi:hypothetical protein